jgi:DNA repair protein RadC
MDMTNLTNIETIYNYKLRTISLKVDQKIRKPKGKQAVITSPQDAYELLREIYKALDDDQEHFVLLVLNQANRVIGYKVLFTGSQDASIVDPKVIFRNAVLLGARSIIVAHNHPSGNPDYSREDMEITRRIVQLGKLHEIPLLDHIVMAGDKCRSILNLDNALFLKEITS